MSDSESSYSSSSSSSSSCTCSSSSSDERRKQLKRRRAIIAKLEADAAMYGGGKLTAKQKIAMRRAFYKGRSLGYTLPQIQVMIRRAIAKA